MAKRRRIGQNLFLTAKISGQEVHLESSGDGSERYPRHIGTYIELTGELEAPLKGTTSLAISIHEVAGSLQENGHSAGMIFSVKPVVSLSLWVDRYAEDRLVTLVSARRITDFYATTEPPRYGRAQLLNWSLRTAPEPE